MPDTTDPPPNSPSPPENFNRRVGCLGAIFVYVLSLCMMTAAFLPAVLRERLGWRVLTMPDMLLYVAMILLLCLAAAAVGFFAGREGARSRSVNRAFLQGGIFCGLATLICLVAQVLGSMHTDSIHARGYFSLRFHFFMILTAIGALVSGMAAILVRDRRESGRTRLIPQFTLQEIFIVFTVVSVIISAITSMTLMRL